jgi:hypothetical protein
MKRPNGLTGLYLASSLSDKTLVANSEERLQAVLATLEECRTALAGGANRETMQILSIAILQLRMKLNQISDFELKALCDAMVPDDGFEQSEDSASLLGQRRRALLKLVK